MDRGVDAVQYTIYRIDTPEELLGDTYEIVLPSFSLWGGVDEPYTVDIGVLSIVVEKRPGPGFILTQKELSLIIDHRSGRGCTNEKSCINEVKVEQPFYGIFAKKEERRGREIKRSEPRPTELIKTLLLFVGEESYYPFTNVWAEWDKKCFVHFLYYDYFLDYPFSPPDTYTITIHPSTSTMYLLGVWTLGNKRYRIYSVKSCMNFIREESEEFRDTLRAIIRGDTLALIEKHLGSAAKEFIYRVSKGT